MIHQEALRLIDLHQFATGDVQTPLVTLFGAVGLVLLIACANVANLLLARGMARRRELALRLALGAGRARLVGQLLAESLLLALAGAVLGVVLASWVTEAVAALGASRIPRLGEMRLDATVLAFTLALAALTVLLFGLVPALQSSRLAPYDALRETARGGGASRSSGRLRGLLVVGEVALSLILLVGAGLLIRSFIALMSVEKGFSTDRVAGMEISLPRVKYPTTERQTAFFQQVLERVRALPQVEAAAVINDQPFAGGANGGFEIEGRTWPPDAAPLAEKRFGSPDYFRLMSIPLVRGRYFSDQDSAGAPAVAIISQSLARRYFPDEDPIGKRIDFEWGTTGFQEIVGVVGDVRLYALDEEPEPTIYVPFAQRPESAMVLMVRTASDPARELAAIQQAVYSVDKDQPVSGVQTMESLVHESVATRRLSTVLLAGFAALALLLASLGLYGVVSYMVGQRTQEFGIRMSLGARPLPYRDADRLVVARLSLPDYRDLREQSRAFAGMGLYASNLYNLEMGGETEQILGVLVTPEFLQLTSPAQLGRIFSAEEAREPLALLSHSFWRQRFGGDPGILGKTIRLSNQNHVVIGVMPAEFQLPSAEYKVWVTLDSAMARAPEQAENRLLRIFRCLALLAPGVSLEAAQQEADAIAARLAAAYPETNADAGISFVSLRTRLLGGVETALYVLLAVVGLVLLIACANVSNVLLTRHLERRREIALRNALGAPRWRLVRQLLTESLVLVGAGGGGGFLLSLWTVELIPSLFLQQLPRGDFIRVDPRVLGFALLVTLLATLLSGLWPALRATARDPASELQHATRHIAGSGRFLARGLVIAETALCVVALVGAGLLVRSLLRLTRSDMGFAADNLLTLNLQMVDFADAERRADLVRQVTEGLARLPGVVHAGGATALPPETAQRSVRYAVPGREEGESGDRQAYFIAATPDYFRALGTPLLQGRAFADTDAHGSSEVVILNQALAGRLFPDGTAVGRQIRLLHPDYGGEPRTIVGVVGDVRYSGLDERNAHAIYTPFAQTPFIWSYLYVRAQGPPELLTDSVKRAVAAVDPGLTAAAVRPMRQLVRDAAAGPRGSAMLTAGFALLALLLAVIGTYAVLSHSVARRTREIGIRIALGAHPSGVRSLVLRQALAPVLVGVVFGLAASAALSRFVASLLFEIEPVDPLTYAGVSGLLLMVSLAAAVVPARRATRVDPILALRVE